MSNASPPSDPGQAPGGQTPQAGTPAQPTPAVSGQQPPSSQFKDLAEAEAAFQRLLKDKHDANEGERSAKAELKKLQDAQLTEAQRAQNRLAELEAEQATYQRTLQELRVSQSVERLASTLGIVDPEAATRLMDWSQLQFDKETGQPTNAKEVLQALVKSKPYLVGQTNVSNPAISPTNPGQQQGQPFFTRAQLEDINFYEKNKAAIYQALQEGRYEK